MSLIQQALEKTKHLQESKAAHPLSALPVYDRDPAGALLEKELVQIQRSYAKRRKLYRKIAFACLAVLLAGGIFFMLFNGKGAIFVKTKSKTVPQVPVRVVSGYLYRLTGITTGNEKAIAVINNRLVSTGDALNNRVVVKKIGKNHVILDVQGKEVMLSL